MTGGYQWQGAAGTPQQWLDLGESMDTSRAELSGASTGGLPPSVQGAAQAFLRAWSGYAEESARMARDLGEGLADTATAYFGRDQEVADALARLDVTLGPGGGD